MIVDGLKQIEITGARGPRSERDKRWLKCEACRTAMLQCEQEFGASVTLLELCKNAVFEGFNGAGYEKATGTRQCVEL